MGPRCSLGCHQRGMCLCSPSGSGESSVLEGATQEQTALPAMPGASKDAATGAQKAVPAAGADAQKAAPVVPTSPAK